MRAFRNVFLVLLMSALLGFIGGVVFATDIPLPQPTPVYNPATKLVVDRYMILTEQLSVNVTWADAEGVKIKQEMVIFPSTSQEYLTIIDGLVKAGDAGKTLRELFIERIVIEIKKKYGIPL